MWMSLVRILSDLGGDLDIVSWGKYRCYGGMTKTNNRRKGQFEYEFVPLRTEQTSI
jgi:hypothetical protein